MGPPIQAYAAPWIGGRRSRPPMAFPAKATFLD
jgi:hypothetical protein